MASPRKDGIACSHVRTDPAEASESRLLEHDSALIVGQACLTLGSDTLNVVGMSLSSFSLASFMADRCVGQMSVLRTSRIATAVADS